MKSEISQFCTVCSQSLGTLPVVLQKTTAQFEWHPRNKIAAALLVAFYFSTASVDAQTPPKQINAPTAASLTIPTSSIPLNSPYSAIGDKPAIVYDAPSAKAQKTFILARQQPVEVLVKLDKWIKIRDAENTLGWVESTALGSTRTVQISANTAEIRAMANPNAAIVFDAQRAVILEATGLAQNGWLPVRHRDGQTGYVSKSQIWGD